MRFLIFTGAMLLLVPTLRAQQTEAADPPPQAVTQQSTEKSNPPENLPAAIRPGHPLDPADVDILTGKRDYEMEVARRGMAFAPLSYYEYPSEYGLNSRGLGTSTPPLLPFRQINNPLFFLNMPPGGFGFRGFRGGRR